MRRYLLVALWPAGLAAIAVATAAAARKAPAVSGRGAPDWMGPSSASGFPPVSGDWMGDLVRLAAIGGGGAAASYKVMALLDGRSSTMAWSIDEPLFRWTEDHQVGSWAAIMRAAQHGRECLDHLGGCGRGGGVPRRELAPAALAAASYAGGSAAGRSLRHRQATAALSVGPGRHLIRWVHIRRVAPTGSSCSPA